MPFEASGEHKICFCYGSVFLMIFEEFSEKEIARYLDYSAETLGKLQESV